MEGYVNQNWTKFDLPHMHAIKKERKIKFKIPRFSWNNTIQEHIRPK